MLSIAPLNSGSDAASGTSLSSFDSIDEGLFASFFSQLSYESESTEAFSQRLMDGEQGVLELADLSSDESLEKLVSWLQQRSDDGKALPPGITLEPEIMEKAESLFALLAEYQQEQSVPEEKEAELLFEAKADESLKPRLEAKANESAETLIETAHWGVKPLEERVQQGQLAENNESKTVTGKSDPLMQSEPQPTKEHGNSKITVKSGLSQAQTTVLSQTESIKQESIEIKTEQAALAQQNGSLGGVSLEDAAKLVQQSKGVKQIQGNTSKEILTTMPREEQSIESVGEPELSEEPQLKASSILMPPPARHEHARAMAVPTSEPEKTQPSNLSQIQSLGGKQLNNDKTTEAGFNVASLFAQEIDAASVEEPEAEIGNLNLKEKTLVLKKSAETNNQVVTPKSVSSSGQQQTLNTSAETAEVAEAEASDLLSKSAQASLNVQAQEVARESLRPQTVLSSAERIRAEAEKQPLDVQQSFFDTAEALSESPSAAEVKHESAEVERHSAFQMRRSLGELANLTMTSQTPESSSTAMGSQPLHAQQQVVQAAQEISFTQQLAQAQEKLQILQEKFAPMLGQRLFMMLDQKVQQAEIQLDPPELGSMMVRVQVNPDQQAQVSFVAHNAQAKDALEQAIPRLKEMFQQQAMELVQAEVSYQQRERGGQQEQQESRQGQFSGTEVGENSPETLLSSQPQQIILQTGKVDFYA